MVFVVTEGTLRGLNRPTKPLPPKLSIAAGYTEDYYEIWRKHRAVRTTISFLARNIAQLGIHTFNRGDTEDERQRLRDHPVALLLEQPNPATTPYRLKDSLVHDLGIFDRSFWLKIKAPDRPGGLGLVRIPPTMVTPIGENWITPDSFEIAGSKGKRTVNADEVVYFRGYNGKPGEDFGTSPIESLRQDLAEDYHASVGREQIWRNGTRMNGYITRPKDAPKWTDPARQQFAAGWQSQYTGVNGAKAGGTPVLEEGMQFVPASMSAKDLQYIETRKLTREEVAAAYHVPPPMVGILDHATFSNIQEQHRMLYQDTLGPWLRMIVEEIELQLVPDVDPTARIYVEFNLREKLTGSFEQRTASIQSAVGGPWMTVNEARALDNRPPIDGGDDLIRPLNVTQNGDQDPIEAEPGNDTTEETAPPNPADDVDDDQEDA
ncbi:portal protein [Gordonia phage Tarzan]|uniref:Portal protein n=1 Tax=Gordonia phage Tarzan TaxID=3038367 RepID=A0AAF0GGH3_9CAUD|nr:portal protein [Gordonia phage Tarzan]WGH20039.1 portal protein [Gordonia phage Tarzan]